MSKETDKTKIETDELKEVEFYSNQVQAFFTTALEKDKSILIEMFNNIYDGLDDYVKKALLANDQTVVEIAREFLDTIQQRLRTHGKLRKVLYDVLRSELRILRNLRSLEPEVAYIFDPLDESRDRNIIYAIRHALKGQIISYKGLFYIIDGFEGFPLSIKK